MNALESRDGKIKVTSKGKQILELSPSELTYAYTNSPMGRKINAYRKGEI